MNDTNFSEIINYLQRDSHRYFLSVWIISLIIVIVVAVIFYSNNSTSLKQGTSIFNQSNNISQNFNKNYFLYLGIICFLIFVGAYIYLIFNKAEFAYYDNDQFTFFSLLGKFYKMPISPGQGRFWPLGLQEYNIISIFSKTPLAYHSFSIFQLLVTILLCLSILPQIKLSHKIILATLILTIPSFVVSFFGLIYPERNIIFWLAIFIFCLDKQEKHKSLIYLCGIFIATQFLLYYKEPIFLLILGFAGSRLIITAFNDKLWHKVQERIFGFVKNNWLDLGLIILSLAFIYLYISNTYGQVGTSYASTHARDSRLSIFIDYLKANPILLIFLLVFIDRIRGLILGKYRLNLIWDTLAIGNLLYFLAYIKLNIFTNYYTAPVDFIATLYLANISGKVFINKHRYKALGIVVLVIIIFIHNIHYSSFFILARKKMIDGKVQTTHFIERYISNNNSNNVDLFFPENSGYRMMQFSAFINYKNFPVLIQDKKPFIDGSLVMKANKSFPDNLCVPYRPFKCFYSAQPEPSNLIIIFLPEKPFTGKQPLTRRELIKKFEKNSVQLFHYQPEFSGIESILYFFCKNRIDELWLNAYVFSDFNTGKTR